MHNIKRKNFVYPCNSYRQIGLKLPVVLRKSPNLSKLHVLPFGRIFAGKGQAVEFTQADFWGVRAHA